MKKLRGSILLMVVAILGITGFQLYWLKNNYDRERENLQLQTHQAFRQTVTQLQASKLRVDSSMLRGDSSFRLPDIFLRNPAGKQSGKARVVTREPVISVLSLLQEKVRDSLRAFKKTANTIMIRVSSDSAISKMMVDSVLWQRNDPGHRLDSLIADPNSIREVHITRGGAHSDDKMIAIGMADKNPAGGNDGSQARVRTKSAEVRTDGKSAPDDSLRFSIKGTINGPMNVFRILYDVDSLYIRDSVRVNEIDSAYARRLKDEKLDVGFSVIRIDSSKTVPDDAVTIGFSQPTSFTFALTNTFGYYFQQLKLPILFSLLLVGITLFSFITLYRNMLRQQRLSQLKNDFISNITHELKTPIATVGVAIEALRNFNAIHDQQRTEEYLSISQNELQRLNLLVDKVLKLSMFEKKDVELRFEAVDLSGVVQEVVTSMRLQLEKYHATLNMDAPEGMMVSGDRLHLLSVVFNLVDNALKYGGAAPQIRIGVTRENQQVRLEIADNGLGIAPEYREKVFEKFFRVPQGNQHNAKGYGLGLSYVAHVVAMHRGSIRVESEPGKGTTFIVQLPQS